MALVPYCIFLAGDVEGPPTGIQGSPVLQLTEIDLSVIYSEIAEPQQLSGDRLQDAALEFHDTVHAVFAKRAVIPFRFPTLLSETELREHLDRESVPYRNFLREHANHVQMEVRLWPFNSAQPQAPATGTEYMQRLVSNHSGLLGWSGTLETAKLPGVREWRKRESRDLVRLFALVDRKNVEEFRVRVQERFHAGDIRMRLSGPWPATEFLPEAEHRYAPHNVASITRGETP